MSEELKKALIRISPGMRPAEIIDTNEELHPPDALERERVIHVGETIKSYLDTAQELLQGRYRELRDIAPTHLNEPGRVIITCCRDGVLIRYEKRVEGREILGMWTQDGLTEVTSTLSQNVVNCYPGKPFTSKIPTSAPGLNVYKRDTSGAAAEEILFFRIGFDVVLERPNRLPQPPLKPYCVLSVQNSFEFYLLGQFQAPRAPQAEKFVIRNAFRLPVGWECLEVYPFLQMEQWKPEYVHVWAENDILRTAVLRQLRESRFRALDPNVTPRARFRALLKEFRNLLDSIPEREETLQKYLHENPILLCPTNTGIWPKLDLGARQTDFVFREATGDFLLVELERSTHGLFIRDGNTSAELNHAFGQILDWKRYLEDNLRTVQAEKGLAGISTNPKSLIVIGRSESLTPENRRKLTTLENQCSKLKIMTYDDVYESTKALAENLFGPIWETGPNSEVYYITENVPSGMRLLPDFL